MVEGLRSAEPPTISGILAASALSTRPPETRVASGLPSGVYLGSPARQSLGSSRAMRRLSSAACAGKAFS